MNMLKLRPKCQYQLLGKEKILTSTTLKVSNMTKPIAICQTSDGRKINIKMPNFNQEIGFKVITITVSQSPKK